MCSIRIVTYKFIVHPQTTSKAIKSRLSSVNGNDMYYKYYLNIYSIVSNRHEAVICNGRSQLPLIIENIQLQSGKCYRRIQLCAVIKYE